MWNRCNEKFVGLPDGYLVSGWKHPPVFKNMFCFHISSFVAQNNFVKFVADKSLLPTSSQHSCKTTSILKVVGCFRYLPQSYLMKINSFLSWSPIKMLKLKKRRKCIMPWERFFDWGCWQPPPPPRQKKNKKNKRGCCKGASELKSKKLRGRCNKVLTLTLVKIELHALIHSLYPLIYKHWKYWLVFSNGN